MKKNCVGKRWSAIGTAGAVALTLLFGFCEKIPSDAALPGADNISAPPLVDTTANPLFDSCKGAPCSCACDDPFDPRVRVDTGYFAGKCLNTCDQRSVRLLTKEEVAANGYFPADSVDTAKFFYVANLSGYDSSARQWLFYVGRVPRDGVADALVQVECAGGIRSHGELRFRFDPAHSVLAVPQRRGGARIVERWNDLVYSVEALGPPGVPYKGDFGFRRQYRVAYRFMSLAGMAAGTIDKQHRAVGQFRVDLSKEQCRRALEAAVRQGSSLAYGDSYHTTENNCVQAVFSVLDKVKPVAWYRKPLLWATNRTLFLPTRAPHHLRYRGMASDLPGRFRVANLEVELDRERLVDTALVSEAKTLWQ
jgi:hypothetical protein